MFLFLGDLKLNLLKLETGLQEQLVQLERQKTMLLESTPLHLDSSLQTQAASESNFYIKVNSTLN